MIIGLSIAGTTIVISETARYFGRHSALKQHKSAGVYDQKFRPTPEHEIDMPSEGLTGVIPNIFSMRRGKDGGTMDMVKGSRGEAAIVKVEAGKSAAIKAPEIGKGGFKGAAPGGLGAIFDGKEQPKKQDGLADKLKGAFAKPKMSESGRIGAAKGFVRNFDKKTLTPRAPPKGAGKDDEPGRKMTARIAKGMSTQRIDAGRAMGQLKASGKFSKQAKVTPGNDEAAQLALNAFEQGRSVGSEAGLNVDDTSKDPVGGGGGGGIAGGSSGGGGEGSGADFETSPTDAPLPDLKPPSVGAGGNVTDYQKKLDDAYAKAGQGRKDKKTGMWWIALGVITVLAGIYAGGWWGALIAAIGIAMIGVGINYSNKGEKAAQEAQLTAQEIKDEHGQEQQGQLLEDTAKQAEKGEEYIPPETPVERDNIRQDVEAERSATYNEQKKTSPDIGFFAPGKPEEKEETELDATFTETP
ncbi:MAG: hypothetical protein ABIJ96_02610 [Elusimicrobiota bacterium]